MSNHITRDKSIRKSNHITRASEEGTKPTRYYSKKQEDAVAQELEGHRQPNSGATAFAKGDVTLDNFLLECKTKTKSSDSITVKKEWFEKNRQEALFIGKPYSAVVINFGPDEENYYIIDESLFKTLLNKISSEEES